jgi:hypothetical protein
MRSFSQVPFLNACGDGEKNGFKLCVFKSLLLVFYMYGVKLYIFVPIKSITV